MIDKLSMHEILKIEFLEIKNFDGFAVRQMVVTLEDRDQFCFKLFAQKAKNLMVTTTNKELTTWKEETIVDTNS